ncbi:MAG: hypothetical protein WCR42_12345 [bacterium]
MSKVLTIALLIFVCISTTFGQTQKDSIRIKKVFLGNTYYYNEKLIDIRKMGNIMRTNKEAYSEIKSAETSNTFATILGYAGGFMIGWPLGSALGGGETNWTMVGIGVGIVAVGIPISIHADNKVKKAVQIYNKDLQTSSLYYETEIKFAFTGNGVGLIIKF